MKVIFLDFDGVLVNRKSWYVRSGSGATADPPCVEALNKITDATGACIVVSSTWRIGRRIADIRGILKGWGVTGKVLGCTPNLAPLYRGDEILTWVARWSANRELVTEFVILDDESDMEILRSRLVQTEFNTGLMATHAEQAIQILGRIH